MLLALPHVLAPWVWANGNADITEGQRQYIDQGLGQSLLWWNDLQNIPTADDIDLDIGHTKKQLHGRQRSDMRLQVNSAVRRREKLRKQGKWRQVIKSLLGTLAGRRHQEGVDLSILKTDGGRCTESPEEVHHEATKALEEWFGSPEEHNRGIHTNEDWERTLRDKQYFLSETAYTGVPLDLRDLIHDSLVNVEDQQAAENHMNLAFQEVPTFEEWQEVIRSTHNNSSGGVSGCSYNQLKHWPIELSLDVYSTLVDCWADKAIASGWKWRWLVPIPKKAADIPSIKDLRPLILVEAVRKVWSKLVLGKMKEVWKQTPLLDEAQHGYTAHRSTMTASLLHINLLEDAIHRNSELHTSSYDLSKAFDSVSKNIMRIAWRRLGVPKDVVEWLVEMDINGVTIVRTPYAAEQWNKHGYQSVQLPDGADCPVSSSTPIEALLEAFTATRGTGQGDVTSPTCWLALFDILLLALHRDSVSSTTTRLVRGGGNSSYAAHETAYADDLHAGCLLDTADAADE